MAHRVNAARVCNVVTVALRSKYLRRGPSVIICNASVIAWMLNDSRGLHQSSYRTTDLFFKRVLLDLKGVVNKRGINV